ncbi:MAG TPA: S46 family peptidase [Bryobacteraceae bacterium]|nr:S46 family peptidase [Bryobacteraceae bacterium]
MKFRGIGVLCLLALPLLADEGMWLFNQFPKDQVKSKYNFDVTGEFLDNLRLASLRIGGGSGSFVSPDGLMFTNHRLTVDCISKAGSAQHDYLKDGFYAAGRADELKCPGLEASVLLSLEDITQQVKEAARDGVKPAEAVQKRNAAIARIEKSCGDKTGNQCTVVKLFSGERYDLYQYKKYTDLRLVFAPEFAIAFFGGDPDNLSYPRYDLDVAFLRAYENEKPASTPHYLKWSAEGVKDAGLVFVAGNPGATSRLATTDQLNFYRDSVLPLALARLQTRIEALREFSSRSAGNQRVAQRVLLGFDNTWKTTAGKLIGLKDDRLMARKQNFEKKLRNAVSHDPKLGTDAAKVWDEVAAAYKNWTPFEKPYEVLENPGPQGSSLLRMARQILRLGEERAKPNDQRLPEYRDGALPSLEASLFAPAPIDDSLETVLLTVYLEELKALGEKEAPVKAILGARTPRQAAEEMVRSSKLADVAERRRLAAGRSLALKSEDGLIRLAKLLEDPSRKLLKKHEEVIETLEVSSAQRIAQYRFKVFGVNDYPDATATPRVSFGVVKAYRDKTEAPVPFATTFGGLYHRAGDRDPYQLPQRWIGGKAMLDLVMPFDFASTCDMADGNAGSPAVNERGEIVGLVFDGNIESLALTYLYSDDQARAVHVASQGILEALRKLYKTPQLLKELGVPET